MTCLVLVTPSAHLQADPGVITREDLIPFGDLAFTVPNFEMPVASPGLPLLSVVDQSPEAVLLRRLDSQGKAAGFANVVYDNHDRGHSLPDASMFPRLAKVFFDKELKKLNLDYGLAGRIILPAIVIGNSSTAITQGKRRRSQPRLSMTTPGGPVRAFLTYVTNHLYVYPEHRDHDKVDQFPANWPYMVISQGSSHSDRPFLRALMLTVAAFSPETQEKLRETKLIAPTLQMILRRSQKTVYKRAAYLSGVAHPTAFNKKELVPERMVALAASIKPEEIPPMVLVSVEEETFEAKAGLADHPETLFDTPSAIARIWRGLDYSRSMVVSAADTVDPNGHELTFTWALLRGDPDRVRITPRGENGSTAEISIDWHGERKVSPSQSRLTSRVDIGVFAHNGFHDSAPAFISVSFPSHQIRSYEERPDGQGMQLTSIDYDAKGRKTYYDPVLHWSAPWKDTLIYDEAANLVEVKRQFEKETVTLSTPFLQVNGKPAKYSMSESDKHRILSMEIDVIQ